MEEQGQEMPSPSPNEVVSRAAAACLEGQSLYFPNTETTASSPGPLSPAHSPRKTTIAQATQPTVALGNDVPRGPVDLE